MRKQLFVAGLLFLSMSVVSDQCSMAQSSSPRPAQSASVQGTVRSQWHCPADSVSHKLDVGDVPDHSYSISQGKCNITPKDGSLTEKSAATTEFDETWKDSYRFHGRANVTLENGDKVFYVYEGYAKDLSKPPVESWQITGGTGKYQGIKGSGSCAGKTNADSTSDWTCTGTYSLKK